MRRVCRLLLAAWLCTPSIRLEAQDGLSLGAGGGPVFISGDIGWNALGLVRYTPTGWPVGFRVDGSYNSIDLDNPFISIFPSVATTFDTRIGAAMFSVVYQAHGAGSYLLASAGATRTSVTTHALGVEATTSSTDFAAGVGIGFNIRLSRSARLFLEGRFIRIFESDRHSEGHMDVVPINLGFTFDLGH